MPFTTPRAEGEKILNKTIYYTTKFLEHSTYYPFFTNQGELKTNGILRSLLNTIGCMSLVKSQLVSA